MEKVFHFDSPKSKYHSDAAIVWCYDNRFELVFRKYLRRIGVEHSDPIKVAGGARCLASPDRQSDCEFVLDQIRTSIRLHGTKRVLLMLHSDCGAYGGLQGGFGGDRDAEREHHKAQLRLAEQTIRENLPELDVECLFVDFEGVWRLPQVGQQNAAVQSR